MRTVKLSTLSKELQKEVRAEIARVAFPVRNITDIDATTLGYILCSKNLAPRVKDLLMRIDLNPKEESNYKKLLALLTTINIINEDDMEELSKSIKIDDSEGIFEGYFKKY